MIDKVSLQTFMLNLDSIADKTSKDMDKLNIEYDTTNMSAEDFSKRLDDIMEQFYNTKRGLK